MPRAISSPDQFVTVGENIHATRVVLRNGRKTTTLENGTEAVPFTDEDGEQRFLTVPDWYKKTQPYDQGQIKHFMIAARKGIGDDTDEAAEGAAYVHAEIRRQTEAGADFLDLNVDEISPNLDVQKRAMAWLVETFQEKSTLPPSIDSSNPEIIAAGLTHYDGRAGKPMINSCSLERLETLDSVVEYGARVIVTAAGDAGMPQDDEERVENADRVMAAAAARGVPLGDMYVDGLVFPISVDQQSGGHYFDAVRELRNRYGPEIHITGGLSNVSFGLPKRRLINDTFIYLALEAGIDSGIIDPVQSKMSAVFDLDMDSERMKLAADMLLGRDEFCMSFIKAYRDGRL